MRIRLVLFATLLIAIILGSPRVRLSRRRSHEGIEDPEAAKAYDWISRWPQFRFLRRLVVDEMARYNPRGTVVDIGCGPGYLLAVMARAFPDTQLVGVDLSEEMTATAARNLAALGPARPVEFRTGDVHDLPFEDGTVDFAVSSLSLHHWSDPRHALEEIYRILRPGGQMLVFDLRRDVRRGFYGLFRLATRFVVPAPLRRFGEPLGSLLSSYTPAEVWERLSTTPFARRRVKAGPLWFFVWAEKS